MNRHKILWIILLIMLITACAVNPQSKNEQLAKPTQLPVTQSNQPVKKPSPSVIPPSTATLTETVTPEEIGFYQTPTHKSSWPTETNTYSSIGKPTKTEYPTFIPESVVTVTPAQMAICPPENPDFVFPNVLTEDNLYSEFTDFILNAISSGASFDQIEAKTKTLKLSADLVYQLELTGDHSKELIVQDPAEGKIMAITCENGKYRNILNFDTISMGGFSPPSIVSIEDLNHNNVPDVILGYSLSTGSNTAIDILEWDGIQLSSLLLLNHGTDSINSSRLARGLYWYYGEQYTWWDYPEAPFAMNCYAEIKIKDIDNNNTKEVILNDDGPCHIDSLYTFAPWSGQQLTFSWNGDKFIFSAYELDPPQYRFQAVQEADRAFILREYDRAMALYDKAINQKSLEMWSKEKINYLRDMFYTENYGGDVSEIIETTYTLDEYQKLSAYARYRMMIMQLISGDKQSAFNSFQNLDQIYSEGNPGYAYAEMGRIYWQAVQDGKDYVEACQPVISYALENAVILNALGDNKHGGQSHEYEPEDVCPLDEMDVKLLQE